MHKNHKVVLNALLHLKNKEKLKNIYIVSTGSKEEHRNTEYFHEIEKEQQKHEQSLTLARQKFEREMAKLGQNG